MKLLQRPTFPKIEFGKGKPSTQREYSPVSTYYMVLVPALILAAMGLVMAFSSVAVTNLSREISPYAAFLKPLTITILALGVGAFAAIIPPRVWYNALWVGVIFVSALAMQSLVLSPLGVDVGGNRNWIVVPGFGGMTVQPSEFLKLALILAVARWIARPGSRLDDWKQMSFLVGSTAFVGIAAILIGHDVGTAIVATMAVMGAIWVAGVRKKWMAVISGVGIFAAAILVSSNPTRRARILAVLPWNWKDADLSAPTQENHALWALGSGGLFGLGPGASRAKWNYLQAAESDFVLAIIGEEFGFVGVMFILISFAVLTWGILRVSDMSVEVRDDNYAYYGQIVSGGIAAWIATQGLINITSATNLGPVIGVPLPLVSYGGSSLLFTAAAIGCVLSFARANAGLWQLGRHDIPTGVRDPRVRPRRKKAKTGKARASRPVGA